MSNQVATLPKNFGVVPDAFRGSAAKNDELGQGVASSYGIIGYRGKVWSTKYQGVETPLMREDGDGARGSIEVVIVKAAAAIAKIYYKNGYQDGANMAPDCWSSDGIKPDAAAQGKVSPTCANCPMNAWGSRVTDAGKPGKACSDSRRIAVVPLNDMHNEMLGGPMLLRVPAASLKDLKAYGDLLNGYNFPYYAVATRISFDPAEAYPKFVFSAIRPLTNDEALTIAELRNDRRVSTVISEMAQEYKEQAAEEQVPSSPFEQSLASGASPASPTTTSPKASATTATKTSTVTPATAAKAPAKAAASKPAPKPLDPPMDEEEVDEETGEVLGAETAVASFDEMLDKIL
jgi:hypothetical protein